MKRIPILLILCSISLIQYGQIIADHTVVDRYDDIPQYYIDEVKKMWLSYAGESHSAAIRTGLTLLESSDPIYQVNITESGTPLAYTSSYLRASRATWGDLTHSTGWIYSYGEEDWFTSSGAIAQTKTGLAYCRNTGPALAAFGFGWCWDPAINSPAEFETYIEATKDYINYCKANAIDTKVFFTTGTVDITYADGYNQYLGFEQIRDSVLSDNSRFLFDYADILCYDNGSEIVNTKTWGENTYPIITTTNLGDGSIGHIGPVGALRLAKAMWWMLARMAGWDGGTSIAPGTWLGVTTDWNNSSNWPVGVPSITTDVIISASAYNQPFILNSPTAICNNLTINPDATLTINSGQSLTVNGNLSNSGTIFIESEYSNEEPVGLTLNGSLVVIGTSTGNVTYNRSLRLKDARGDRHFFSAPVGAQTIEGFTTANSSDILQLESVYQIWEYNEFYGTWLIVSDGDFVAGKGYNLSQATGGDGLFTFTGSVLNSVNFTATSPYINGYTARATAYDYGLDNPYPIWSTDRSWTNYGGGGWNLMGNPFTSAMDAALFISTNSGKFDPYYEALYVYDGINDQYEYAAASIPGFTQSGSLGSVVQAGQGFFVLALYDNIVFNFRSEMQVHNTSIPMIKSAVADEPWPGLQLKVKYGSNEGLTTIVYNSEMTTGLDPGYDVGQFSAGPDVEIYTALVLKENSVNFARQALPIIDCDKNIVPVGIDSEKGGEVTFSANSVPLAYYKFWLEDRKTGIFTDLNSYSYSATLPANTYGTGRFFIYASANTPTAVKTPREVPDIRVWAYNDKVIIKGSVSERATCEIYDLQGQKVLISRLTDGELNIVNLFSVSRGVYLVRVVDGMKVYTNKIALL